MITLLTGIAEMFSVRDVAVFSQRKTVGFLRKDIRHPLRLWVVLSSEVCWKLLC